MHKIQNRNCVIAALASLILAVSAHSNSSELPERVQDTDYYDDGNPSRELVDLGKNLFFDKILSGNKNISCATCHNPLLSGADALSLGVGEGGRGIGRYRTTGVGEDKIEARIGRNAPHLFNLGAKEFVTLNWNGIMRTDPTNRVGFNLPSGIESPQGLSNVLAAQSLFPIANLGEMVGQEGENEVADAAIDKTDRFLTLWEILLQRLRDIPEYVNMFRDAFDDVSEAADIEIQHYGNAVSAFQAFAFRSDNSQFDQYIKGNTDALTDKQISGMELFYGDAGCSSCHSGPFQTDHKFYGIAMPQVGPGSEEFPLEDSGLFETTRLAEDWAKFRTPSLRNVWVTAPYGHTGAYNTLKSVVEHHLDPLISLENYRIGQLIVPKDDVLGEHDYAAYDNLEFRQKIIDANDLQPMSLSRQEVGDILEFLRSLTDWNALNQDWMIPQSVPSGLPVED
ncbi:MAG: cytochrome c peroxidase [Paraglaciecola sp.]|jgi:cytochrome c peroxidase